MRGNVGIPSTMKDEKLLTFTNSNWDAQDASAPRQNEAQTVDMEEMKSIQGHYVIQMGVHYYGGCTERND